MRRTHAANNVGTLPTRSTSGTPGYHVDRNVVGGVPGTTVGADELNVLQEEIMSVLADWSVTPDDTGADVGQLAEAIRLAVAAIASGAVSVAGDTAQTRVLLGSTNGFVGGNDLTLLAATDRASCEGVGSAILASVGATPNYCSIESGVTYSALLACFGAVSIEDIVTTSAIVAASASAMTTSGSTNLIGGSNDAYIDASSRCVVLGTEGTTGVMNGSDCAGIIASGASGASSLNDAHSSAVLATNVCLIDGGSNASLVAASGSSTITNATHDAILASYNSSITASPSGSSTSAMIGTDSCAIPVGSPLFGVVMLGSLNCDASLGSMSAADKAYSVMGGYNGSTPSARTWGIESQTGTFRGSAAYATGGLDYAEFFSNFDGVRHAPGRLLARQGRAARLARPGDRILGIVSADPTVVGGDDGIAWSGRYLRDEWGRPVTETVVDGERTLTVRKTNPAWVASQTQVPRAQRPDEWTVVGLVGQLRLAVDGTVGEGDDIVAGPDGIGTKGEWIGRGAQVEVMEITQKFSKKNGYGIALVFIR